MIKVAIIEDEPMILRNLALFVQRLDDEFSLVNQFMCGSDFLKYITDEFPDIIISDIRLPDMLGTDLLKRCKEINPNVKFIIISAYKSFEYAQSAIEYKADAYITKPIDRVVLSQTILNLKEELSKNISYHYDRSVNELLRKMLTKCVEKEIKTCSELKFELEKYNILNIASNSIFEAYVSVNNISSISLKHSYDAEYVMTSLSNFILMPDFSSSGICIHKAGSAGNMLKLYISVPSVSQRMNDIYGVAASRLNQINSACMEYLGFSFEYSIICVYTSIYNFLDEKPIYYTNANLCGYELFADFNISSMVVHYCENNECEYMHCAECISAFLTAAESENPEHYKQYCSLTAEKFTAGFTAIAPSVDGVKFNGNFSDSFKSACKKLFERHSKSQGEKSLLAEMAMKYIDDNISSQTLTLTEISNSCYTHPVYLSRVFKQTYDMTIHQCITSHRIIKAKDMLRRGASLNETSYACGYKTVKYFSKIFKQITGESPSKYKKRWNYQ